ncbi:MAG: tRNA modification GTPase, partial [Pseudomonadota bacterium]
LTLAEPGEFTRRALQNGRLDLSQVEGLADLINAETSEQHHQAIRVMGGSLAQAVDRWRGSLVRAAALIAASIDFSDEELPPGLVGEVLSLLQTVTVEITGQLSGAKGAERVRTGFEVALLGAPNTGKSTLLNWIAGREVALTSDTAGTTRDVIEVRCDIGGLPVTLMDTAGVRESADPIERMGVRRAKDRAQQADLRVFLTESSAGLSDELESIRQQADLVFSAKSDLYPDVVDGVSGHTGDGVPQLLAAIESRVTEMITPDTLVIRKRHQDALSQALQNLKDVEENLSEDGLFVDLAAEQLRVTLQTLDSVVGKVGVEDLLDEIFKSFCLGK